MDMMQVNLFTTNSKGKMRKKCIYYSLLIAMIVICLLAIQNLLVPKYMGAVIEGQFIREYYDGTKDNEVIILGDCEAYENISPITLWEEYGITSYIRGSANQLPAQSYYLLEDTLRYETPKVVIFSVLAMGQEEQDNEAYNRMTMEGMKWSSAKVGALRSTMMAEEHLAEYLFPILRYHSRWKELEEQDFKYYFQRDKVSHNGYYMRMDTMPAGRFPTVRPLPDYQFSDKSYEYLDKLRILCEKNDISLILLKAPSLYPHWYDEWDEQIVDYANEHNLQYINCLQEIEEIGLDYSQDTYNGGMHLNTYGAEKLSLYLGEYLKENYELNDRCHDETTASVWKKKQLFYEEMKQQQLDEIRNHGEILRFRME